MSSVIQNLLDNALGDGARSTKFECFINFKADGIFANQQDIVALTKTSQFPGKTQEVIDMKFKGRSIPIKGQVKYDNTWSCTFYLTQDHALKKGFEDWIEAIDQNHNMSDELSPAIRGAQKQHEASGYTTQMSLAQMDFSGTQQTVLYNLYNVFPKSVSAIDVDYSEVGSITEVTVEFSYSHYDVYIDKTNLNTFADEIKAKAQGAISDVVGDIKQQISGFIGEITNPESDALKTVPEKLEGPSSGDDVAGPDFMFSRFF